jgi:hypothetical protein
MKAATKASTSPKADELHPNVRHTFFWLPRLLGIAFAAFLGVFALDVLGMPLSASEKAIALFMHLVPMMLVLAVLALVWRWEWAGAVLFPALAFVHLIAMWGRLDISGYVVIEVPLLLIGGLFLMSWLTRGRPRESIT